MRFIAFARQVRSALTFVARRVPAAFTRIDRLFMYRSAYRAPGDDTAGFERARSPRVPLKARARLRGTLPVQNCLSWVDPGRGRRSVAPEPREVVIESGRSRRKPRARAC